MYFCSRFQKEIMKRLCSITPLEFQLFILLVIESGYYYTCKGTTFWGTDKDFFENF